ncbi:MAG TPA: hypothetical protein VFN67_17660 [Polyangiales bacterium]|nr:hypothetical protein [Polyangiales bacterium]
MTFKLASGYLHLEVLVAPRCRAADEGFCPPGKPISNLRVAVRTAVGVKQLGTTWSDGGLELPFSTLDALFPNQASDRDARAPLLVEDRIVSELPIGEIFRSIVVSAIKECDAALANADLQPDYAQALLGRMLDLQLLGLADDKLVERTVQLSMRVREEPASMWSQPRKQPERGRELIAGLDGSVPADVKRQITKSELDELSRSSLQWALNYLPTVCKVTVKGGEFVGQIILSGAPGVALAVLDATVGDVYSDWMVKTCCQRLSEMFGADRPPECFSSEQKG